MKPNSPKQILIVYGSVGLGHKVVAENIAAILQTYPELKVTMLDTMQLYEGRFLNLSTQIYQQIIKSAPGLWRFFYNNKFFQKLTLPLRLPLARLRVGKLRKILKELSPHLILTTHPTATALAVAAKQAGWYQGLIVTTFSDFHFQAYWVYPGVDRYLVMTEEQKTEVIRRGFVKENVVTTGLPVNPVFQQTFESSPIYRSFGLSRTKPIVLVIGGSRGWGIRLQDIEALLNSSFQIQIVVIIGQNPELEEKLKNFGARYPGILKIFGNWSSEDVAKLFAVAKILITKPGGLTIAQALLKNLPMVLVNPLPAMEELNQDFLLNRGAAVAAKNSKEVKAWVERLLQDKKFYREIQARMKLLASPQASELAAGAVIDILKTRY